MLTQHSLDWKRYRSHTNIQLKMVILCRNYTSWMATVEFHFIWEDYMLPGYNINSVGPGWYHCDSNRGLSEFILLITFRDTFFKLLPSERHRTPLVISLLWFSLWIFAIRQQVTAWANFDPGICRHIASQGHNESNSGTYERFTMRISSSGKPGL